MVYQRSSRGILALLLISLPLIFPSSPLYAQAPPAVVWMQSSNLWPNSLRYSPDGKTLAVSCNGNVKIWDVSASFSTLKRTIATSQATRGITFTTDGQAIYAGASNASLGLWRVSDGSLLRRYQMPVTNPVGQPSLNYLALTPDGSTLIASGWDGNTTNIYAWKTADSSLLWMTSGSGPLAIAPNGEFFISTEWSDSSLRIRRISDGQTVQTWTGHSGQIYGIAFSPDGQTVISGAGNGAVFPSTGEIRRWRAADGTLLQVLNNYIGQVYDLAYAPDGKTFASYSWDSSGDTVRLWNAFDGSLLYMNSNMNSPLAYSPDSKYLAYNAWVNRGRENGYRIQFLQLSDASNYLGLGQLAQWAVSSLYVDPTGRYAYTSGLYNSYVSRTEIATGYRNTFLPLYTFPGVASIDMTANEKLLCMGSGFGNYIPIFDFYSAYPVRTLIGTGYSTYLVRFSPDGSLLAAVGRANSEAGTVQLFRVADGTLLWKTRLDYPRALSFVGDSLLVAGGINNLILSRLLLSSGSVTGSARLLGSPPLSAAFSRDGSLLASGAQNGGLFLYNTSNGGQVSYVRNVRIYDMNFSEDGKRLISAGGFSGQYDYAGVVRQWKVPTLEPLAVYSSETSQAFRVAYTPDGQNFLYGRWDGVLVYAAVRPFVRLSVTAQNGTVGQNVRLTALLKSRDGEAPLAGKSVTFYAVPASQPTPEAPLDIAIGTATTDANGVASLVYTIPEDVAANRVIMAQYAGDTDYDPGLGQAVLVASPLRTGLSVANPTARPKQTIGLRAVLRRAGGVPLVGRTLTYAIGTTTLGTAVTDATGTTSLPYTLDASATGTITFTVTYAGEASYQPVSGTGTITVTP